MSFYADSRSVDNSWSSSLSRIFTTDEFLDASISELMNAMDQGRISSEQLVSMYLDRISAYDKELGLNSFITVSPYALDEARAADESRASGGTGRLLGIPFIVKDNIDVAGLPTTNGSASKLDNIASSDAEVVRRLRAEGAVIIGKSNMSENSSSGSTSRSSAGGRVHNAYDTSRTPAGSSGGTAVAVTCNFAVFGIGTDTNSSIRRPASFAGIYGFRPSYGLISRSGVTVNYPAVDTVGILARSVQDTSLILDIIAGTDPDDSYSSDADSMIPESGYILPAQEEYSFEGIRIGYLANSFGYYVDSESGDSLSNPTPLSSRISGMTDRAIAVFTENGGEVVDISSQLSEEYISRLFNSGASFGRRVISEILDDLEIDAVIYVSQTDVPELESSARGRYDNAARYINIFSPHLGLPEIVLPMGVSEPDGTVASALALGICMFGRYGDEALLLDIAERYNNLSDSRVMPPTVPALPDSSLTALSEELLSRAGALIESGILSPESLEKISALSDRISGASMTGTDGAVYVTVSEYREMLAQLCSLLDTAELLYSRAPVSNIETISFYLDKYRRTVVVSSVSLLLFVFAMILGKPGRKQKNIFDAIPQLNTQDADSTSASERIRQARAAVKQERKLVRQARRALRKGEKVSVKDILGPDSAAPKTVMPEQITVEVRKFSGVTPHIERKNRKPKKKQSLIKGTMRNASAPKGERNGLLSLIASLFTHKTADTEKKNKSTAGSDASAANSNELSIGRAEARKNEAQQKRLAKAEQAALLKKQKQETEARNKAARAEAARVRAAEKAREEEARKQEREQAALLRKQKQESEAREKAARAEAARIRAVEKAGENAAKKEQREQAAQLRSRQKAEDAARRRREQIQASQLREKQRAEAEEKKRIAREQEAKAAELRAVQKAETAAKKQLSREKAARIKAEAKAAARQKRKETVSAFIKSVKARVVSLIAAFITWINTFSTSISNKAKARKAAKAEKKNAAAALRVEQRREAQAERAREEKLAAERRKAEAEKKEAARVRKEQEAEAREQEKQLKKQQELARKATEQKIRAAASKQKKLEKAERKAAQKAAFKSKLDSVFSYFRLRAADRKASRAQRAIEAAAKRQHELLERNRLRDEKTKLRLEEYQRRNAINAEKRRLQDEKKIQRKAAAEFRKKQRKQKRQEFVGSIRQLFVNAAQARRSRAEQRRIKTAEKLFIRNTQIRDRKRQIEELKAERLRLARESKVIEKAEEEKKVLAENERREAEAAYRALVEQKISDQVEYLEAKSRAEREAKAERERQREALRQEKAAKKAAVLKKQHEEEERIRLEKEEMRNARIQAENERKERIRKLKEEKKAAAERKSFEKNKDRIISAQRREIEVRNRREKRRTAKENAAKARFERKMLVRKKVSIFFRDLPLYIASAPSKIGNSIKAYIVSVKAKKEEQARRKAEAAEKKQILEAQRTRRKNEEKAAAAAARKAKSDATAAVRREKTEKKAVAARLKKQQAAEIRSKKEKEKQAAAKRRSERRAAAASARAARRAAANSSIRKVFTAVGTWIRSVFSTTGNWIKRIYLIIAGIITFIFSIPVMLFKALMKIPGIVRAGMSASRDKRKAKAETAAYTREQKRIAKEKQSLSVSGVSTAPVSAVNVPDSSSEGTGAAIRNMEKEAPFAYRERLLRDFLKPKWLSRAVIGLTFILQTISFIVFPMFIADALKSIRNGTEIGEMIPYALVLFGAAGVGAVSHFINRITVSKLIVSVTSEIRRVEFSIKKTKGSSVSLDDEIHIIQELIITRLEFAFDLLIAVTAVCALCISSPLNAIVMIISMIIYKGDESRRRIEISRCKNIDEAVSVREAIAIDWARKLRVNKLLGRGNDSYDNLRNAVLDVNIRKLAVKDVETDHSVSRRTVLYAVSVICAATAGLLIPGTSYDFTDFLYTGIQLLAVVPGALDSAASEYQKLKSRKTVLASFARKLDPNAQPMDEENGSKQN